MTNIVKRPVMHCLMRTSFITILALAVGLIACGCGAKKSDQDSTNQIDTTTSKPGIEIEETALAPTSGVENTPTAGDYTQDKEGSENALPFIPDTAVKSGNEAENTSLPSSAQSEPSQKTPEASYAATEKNSSAQESTPAPTSDSWNQFGDNELPFIPDKSTSN